MYVHTCVCVFVCDGFTERNNTGHYVSEGVKPTVGRSVCAQLCVGVLNVVESRGNLCERFHQFRQAGVRKRPGNNKRRGERGIL